MPRNRAVAVVAHDEKLLVMYRKNTREYFTFPGGGIEPNETNEQAAIREIKEETSVDIRLGKLRYELHYENGDKHYYFLAEYLAGEPHIMPGTNEHADNLSGKDTYEPRWLPLQEAAKAILYPLEVRDQLMKDLKQGYQTDVRVFDLPDV